MTTIIADPINGVIAYDSFFTHGDYILDGDCEKRVERGGISFFFAGDAAHEEAFMDAYPGGKIDKGADIDAFVVDGGAIYLAGVADGVVWRCPIKKTYAIGIGGPVALGAMAHGASVEEAVKTSIDLVTSSGGKIRTYKL